MALSKSIDKLSSHENFRKFTEYPRPFSSLSPFNHRISRDTNLRLKGPLKSANRQHHTSTSTRTSTTSFAPYRSMLPGSTLELSWDHEIQHSLDPALSIQYLGGSSLFFKPSPSSFNFSVSHKTYSSEVALSPLLSLFYLSPISLRSLPWWSSDLC
jgi:hypothetical protein